MEPEQKPEKKKRRERPDKDRALENYTEEQENHIAVLVDVLLSVGANWEQVRMELFRVAQAEGAVFKKVPSQSTLERMLKDKFGYKSLTEWNEKRKEGIKIALKNKAVHMALAGNAAMLIFCLKNLCQWSDNVPTVIDKDEAKKAIRLAYDRDAI